MVKPPSPAIVSSQAARKLPLWFLLSLCVVYVLAGNLARAPWKSMDVASLGYMLSLADGSSSLFHLQLAGIEPELDAYLPYWLGALAIEHLPWLAPDTAARVPFVLASFAGLYCLWQAIYFLARNPQAQPVAFAFGGEAEPKDYARSLADAGLLGYLACLGLAVPSHELTPMAFQLQTISLIFMGSAVMPFHPLKGMAAWAAGLLLLSLSGAPSLAVVIAVGTLWIWARHPQAQPLHLVFFCAVLLLLVALGYAWDLWQWRILSLEKLASEWQQFPELLVWYLWPAWPLAIWSMWRWRKWWTQQLWSQHLALPFFLFLTTLLASLLTDNPDRTLLLALPSLAALAAFAIPTFSRTASALVDWFTLLFFTTGAIIIWVVWISLESGLPEQPALNVYKLVPGYEHQFDLLAFVIALVSSVLWIKLVIWRVGRHPAALWKSMVLPASGSAVCWVLLMTLWLPFLDRGLSYQAWSEQLVKRIGKVRCIHQYGMDRNQIAGLGYHAHIRFEPLSQTNRCEWLLVNAPSQNNFIQSSEQAQWSWVERFQRPGDKKDVVLIYRRNNPSPSHD